MLMYSMISMVVAWGKKSFTFLLLFYFYYKMLKNKILPYCVFCLLSVVYSSIKKIVFAYVPSPKIQLPARQGYCTCPAVALKKKDKKKDGKKLAHQQPVKTSCS